MFTPPLDRPHRSPWPPFLPRCGIAVLAVGCAVIAADPASSQTVLKQLPGTAPLELQGDIAGQMLDGIHRFLDAQIAATARRRDAWWLDASETRESGGAGRQAQFVPVPPDRLAAARQRLRRCIGLRDRRVSPVELRVIAGPGESPRIAEDTSCEILEVRWPTLMGVEGAGLLARPLDAAPRFCAVVLPDATQTPEQLVGLGGVANAHPPWARRLVDAGGMVVVRAVLRRRLHWRGTEENPRRVELTNREFVYRSAYELGRHPIGYEVHDTLQCIDWFSSRHPDVPVLVAGHGDGGLTALLASALDDRIDAALVSGCWGPRETMWREPIDRNLFGFLELFGCAELAMMMSGRPLVVSPAPGPQVELSGGQGAPGVLRPITGAEYLRELQRLNRWTGASERARAALLLDGTSAASSNTPSNARPPTTVPAVVVSSAGIRLAAEPTPTAHPAVEWLRGLPVDVSSDAPRPSAYRIVRRTDPLRREEIRIEQLRRFHEWQLSGAARVRQKFHATADTSSPQRFAASMTSYRDYFGREVIGRFESPLSAPRPRSRRTWEDEHWIGYEVVLDVWPDVIAYGALLLPKDLQPGQRRPVVVCQHGLEGRPTDTFLGDHRAYRDFAARLCSRGYIVFAPQNIYLYGDRFRSIQRKANPLGKSLFSIMVAQHQQIIDWLQKQPFVDPDRIAFYGLSYGGKSAMRIPALVTDYNLSICSGDFNEWIVKNASTREEFSYVWTGEYEIFEFDLGNTFNYAEMAALICPRPFMVERGHFDGVGHDHWVAHEYAKVRHLYQAQLGIGDRTRIEWFAGPHTIHGQGTFEFLDQFLKEGTPGDSP